MPHKAYHKGWAIYIANSPSGKCYIGLTKNFENRVWNHYHETSKLQTRFGYALAKYGKQIKFSILAIAFDKDMAVDLERYFIAAFNSNDPNYGYNLTSGGEGVEQTEQTRLKISNLAKLRGDRPPSRKGVPVSEATRLKMSEAAKRRFRARSTLGRYT